MFNNVPSRIEIVMLPLAGIVLVELLHTRSNELILFFIPFFLAAIRLGINQLRLSAITRNLDPSLRNAQALHMASSLDQLSVFPLVIIEIIAVVASSSDAPEYLWLFIMICYAIYVALRLIARHKWIGVIDDNSEQK